MNDTLAVMVTGSAGQPSAAVIISKMVWSSVRLGVLRHSPAALGDPINIIDSART